MSDTSASSSNFILDIIEEHLAQGIHTQVRTRFPPEPNGYPHVGHAKSICLNFGIAEHFRKRGVDAQCHLRFDDTNPTTEDPEFVEALKDGVRWLGFDWGEHLYFASDYFDRFYQVAQKLIEDGRAYVCSLNEEAIRETRGTVTSPGTPSPYRDRAPGESLSMLEDMKKGRFDEGAHVLRAKIDMSNPNMKMRDPLLYRIRRHAHYRTGTAWSIYPMYDFAHCLSDAFEGITHSICTLEFENNREVYDWVIEAAGLGEDESKRPRQYEFAKLSLSQTLMSKRILRQLVESGAVSGWDDPRMPTISGMRRRGYRASALRDLCDKVGVAKANSVVDLQLLEHCVRTDLDAISPRLMGVLKPLEVEITNLEDTQALEAPLFPEGHTKSETRRIPFSSPLFIDAEDFAQDPPKGFKRLRPGGAVRLRYAYVIHCDEVITDDAGKPTKLRCHYEPTTAGGAASSEGKVQGVIHWVAKESAAATTFRRYDRMAKADYPEDATYEEMLNPDSLRSFEGWVEPASLAPLSEGPVQLERTGYFVRDPDTTKDRLVLNETVPLKDSWSRQTKAPAPAPSRPKAKNQQIAGDPGWSDEERAAISALMNDHGVPQEAAAVLGTSQILGDFFKAAKSASEDADSAALANLIVNELGVLLKEGADLPDPKSPGAIVRLVTEGALSSKGVKKLVKALMAEGGEVDALVDRLGLRQLNDPHAIEAIVRDVVGNESKAVEDYRGGNTKVLGFLTGKVLSASKGRANPELARKILLAALEG